jgi:hypothetical protein
VIYPDWQYCCATFQVLTSICVRGIRLRGDLQCSGKTTISDLCDSTSLSCFIVHELGNLISFMVAISKSPSRPVNLRLCYLIYFMVAISKSPSRPVNLRLCYLISFMVAISKFLHPAKRLVLLSMAASSTDLAGSSCISLVMFFDCCCCFHLG